MPEGAHDIVAGGLAARRGPLVKRLRHRPLTPVTRVRFPHGSPEEVTCREAFHEIEPGGVETQAGQRAKVPKAHRLRNLEPQARGRRRRHKPGSEHMAGVYYAEVPPVPIPNTEVKLSSAENTWWVTAREDRSMPAQKRDTRLRVSFFAILFILFWLIQIFKRDYFRIQRSDF